MHYQSDIRYTAQDNLGRMRTINESYLFEAADYTEAEAKTREHIAANYGDCQIIAIKKMKLQEVFFLQEREDDQWFKAKVQYITFDEKTQKEKKTAYNMLINADDVDDAFNLLKKRLGPINDYIISDINTTSILEVILNESETGQ